MQSAGFRAEGCEAESGVGGLGLLGRTGLSVGRMYRLGFVVKVQGFSI